MFAKKLILYFSEININHIQKIRLSLNLNKIILPLCCKALVHTSAAKIAQMLKIHNNEHIFMTLFTVHSLLFLVASF